MSEPAGESAESGRPASRSVGAAVSDRPILSLVGVAFWSWLLVYWVYYNELLDAALTTVGVDVLRSEVGTSDRSPFLSPEPLVALSERLGTAADTLGVVGVPVDWLAWTVSAAALGLEFMPQLAVGAWLTVLLTTTAILLGLVIAVPLALARVYGGRPLRAVALGYTELLRGTPLLAQLFVLFFGLPLQGYLDAVPGVGGPLPSAPVLVAVIGFTINSAAYQAEYIRGAIESVDQGQLTAARAVGLSRLAGIRHVVLPQGLRLAIPAWTNEFVYLVKYSSLAAFITVPELFRQARRIASNTLRTTEIYAVVAVFYLVIVLTTAALMTAVERRVAVPGLGGTAD
jgi:polar amino acid transport system permease protein